MTALAPEGASAAFGSPSLEQLTGLVMELAAQLHVERARRIALQAALEAAGVLAQNASEEVAVSDDVKAKTRAALDEAMTGLVRVMTESPDVRAPLRAPARSTHQPSPMER
jgi:hypothetical protein